MTYDPYLHRRVLAALIRDRILTAKEIRTELEVTANRLKRMLDRMLALGQIRRFRRGAYVIAPHIKEAL